MSWLERIDVVILVGLLGCGGEGPKVPSATPNAAPPSAPAVSASAPNAQAGGSCWTIADGGNADEREFGRVFAGYAEKAFARLDHPQVGSAEARITAQLRLLGIGELGPLCPRVKVVLTEGEGGLGASVVFYVDVVAQKPALSLSMAAKLPAIRRGEVPSIETWAFAEPVERTLASALVVQGLKSAFESSPSVKSGSTLKIAPGLLWGWARTDAGVAQCFFATDPPNRLCQLRSPKG